MDRNTERESQTCTTPPSLVAEHASINERVSSTVPPPAKSANAPPFCAVQPMTAESVTMMVPPSDVKNAPPAVGVLLLLSAWQSEAMLFAKRSVEPPPRVLKPPADPPCSILSATPMPVLALLPRARHTQR